MTWFLNMTVVNKFLTFTIRLGIEKISEKQYYISKWRLIQLVIQLITTSVEVHGIVVYVIKT